MGNRGILHDDRGTVVRPWKGKAWIACALQWKVWKRTPFTPGTWSELFFLDEATAFAAGHRPCGECRRDDYLRFKEAWVTGNPGLDLTAAAPVQKIDAILQRDRVSEPPRSAKVMFSAEIDKLPNGTFVIGPDGTTPWLVWGEQILRWTPSGYDGAEERPEAVAVNVLTPRSMVAALDAGYRPSIHSSAWTFGQSVPPLP